MGMPLAGRYSIFIASACYPPAAGVGASTVPVQWGVIKRDVERAPFDLQPTSEHEYEHLEQDGVGHCSFTSFDVTAPIPGNKYR